MGGRGASSGISINGKTYGSEYTAIYTAGNIKFIAPNDGQVKAPLETMTQGRIYVTIGRDGQPRYISYYNRTNKKFKQIDIVGVPHTINGKRELPHTHKGYYHNEKGDYILSPKEKKMIERVRRIWYNRHSK